MKDSDPEKPERSAWTRKVQDRSPVTLRADQLDALLSSIFQLQSAFFEFVSSKHLEIAGDVGGARTHMIHAMDGANRSLTTLRQVLDSLMEERDV